MLIILYFGTGEGVGVIVGVTVLVGVTVFVGVIVGVLVGVDVDYTPAGPSFIRTENSVVNKGRDADICPAAVTLQLQFAEVELWTANDFSANESESFDYINKPPLNVEKPTTVQDAVAASGGGGFSFAGDK